jgi:branched-chain amino acid transport system ATP-binding protein
LTAALETVDVTISFGGVRAVRGVTLKVPPGERRVIIGPNGAGKTTLFNLIAGQLRPSEGRVLFFGEDLTGKPPFRRARRGLVRTFQISRLFRSLTVWENVAIAAQGIGGLSLRSFRMPGAERGISERIRALLTNWNLIDQRDQPVQNISHGNQRLLEIVLALATKPRLILLDEPTAGLSGSERELVTTGLRGLPRDVTVVLTDHDMDVVFDIADHITVLNQGEVIADGTPAEIEQNTRVHEIYFGEE